jgi:SAM-dependent methyltransferase
MVSPTDYDTIASRYAARIDERPWNALYERPTTLALLPHVGGKDVLDAGCGPGWYADWLVRQGARVVAVDSSRGMVELADRRLGGRARVLKGDLRNLRGLIPDQAFDLVLSSLVLHYLDDLSEVFVEWARIPPNEPARPGILATRLDRGEVGLARRDDALLPKAAARFDGAVDRSRVCHRADLRTNAERSVEGGRPGGI